MTSKTWAAGTVIDHSWLQDVNDIAYGLPSNVVGKGASLVALQDVAGNFPTDNVEAALATIVARSYGVNVLKYGADPTGVADSTSAFLSAQTAGDLIYIPPGTYLLDKFQQQHKKRFLGSGLTNTIIKQANTARPAWYVVSKTGVYTTQIIGAELSGVWFLGATGATVASCVVEAIAPFVVANSKFDIGGSNGFSTLQIITGSASEFYNNVVRVVQQPGVVTSDTVGSTSTGVVCGTGAYNHWWLRIVQAQNGKAFTSNGFNEVFHDPITDSQQSYSGQSCVINNAVVEAWTGTAQTGAIENLGFSNKFINVTVKTVPNTSIGGYGMTLNNGSAASVTILGYRILGTYPGTAPLRPLFVGPLSSGFIADAETSPCPNKLEAYCTYDQLKNFTFSGSSESMTGKARKLPADPTFVTTATYTLDSSFATTGQIEETIYLNTSANCTITLPSAASYPGRRIYFCSRVAFSLSSASANVLPLTGGGTTSILAATAGKWAILQAGSGGNWNIIANN